MFDILIFVQTQTQMIELSPGVWEDSIEFSPGVWEEESKGKSARQMGSTDEEM